MTRSLQHAAPSSHPFRPARAICLIALTGVAWLSAAVLLSWLVGRVVSDRYQWSQFLLWIPTPIALVAATAGLIAALRHSKNSQTKRRRRIRWAVTLVAIMVYFGFFEHRFYRVAPATRDGLHIVHWSAWPEAHNSSDRFFDNAISLDADIFILSNAWSMSWWQPFREWSQDGNITIRSMHPFAIISRVPILSARHIVSSDDIVIVLLEFDTEDLFGRPLRMYAVDLPSNLRRGRMETALTARRLLNEATTPQTAEENDAESLIARASSMAPDIILGDFNITRNSAAMQAMFPDVRHAFDEAGHGYGATFVRIFPLYHIDHILLSDTLIANRYDIVDPGVSRHRLQSVHISPHGD